MRRETFRVMDGWSEVNGQDCVDLLTAVLNSWEDFLLSKDQRAHVDNPSWKTMCAAFHGIQIFLHEAATLNMPENK